MMTIGDGTEIPFTEVTGEGYHLKYNVPVESPKAYAAGSVVTGAERQLELWHRRYGHAAYNKIAHLPEAVFAPRMIPPPTQGGLTPPPCNICPLANMKSAPHRNHTKRKAKAAPGEEPILASERPRLYTKFGQSIHMDLAGPLTRSFPHQYRYADIFVDAYSLFIGGYPIHTKDDHENSHIQYCADMAGVGERCHSKT